MSVAIFWVLAALLPFPGLPFSPAVSNRIEVEGSRQGALLLKTSASSTTTSVAEASQKQKSQLPDDSRGTRGGADDHCQKDEDLRDLLSNLARVCQFLPTSKNQPKWADFVRIENDCLVTSQNMEAGDILSLLPIQNLEIPSEESDEGDIDDNKMTIPLLASYGEDEDLGQYEAVATIGSEETRPGWMGHLARATLAKEVEGANPALSNNCVIMPLMGALPLCALVATQQIPEGSELAAYGSMDHNPSFNNYVLSKHQEEIQALAGALDFAYQPSPFAAAPVVNFVEEEEVLNAGEDSGEAHFQFPFHTIRQDYTGLRYLHKDPDVVTVDQFLSDDECDRIIAACSPRLKPCVTRHPITGEIRQDPRRSSTNAELPIDVIPGLVDKILDLVQGEHVMQLEKFQVLKYEMGQSFTPHTDAFSGPITAGGFEDSGRLVTFFCYLNHVSQGGATRFTKLPPLTINGDSTGTPAESATTTTLDSSTPLTISPQKGMAVLHFPATTGLEEDLRTEHEGCPAVDDKWLLVTWLWNGRRVE